VELSRTRRFVFAWIFLVAITLAYLWIDHSDTGARQARTTVTVAAIVLALVKFRVVLREFMDVRHAPSSLRRITDLLTAVIGVSLLASFLIGRAIA
jgi:heme/copper-type cytochrome/quinol oxidase subunit 4